MSGGCQEPVQTTALVNSAADGYGDIVLALLDAGADTSLADDSGNTALISAAMEGQTRIVELLLQHRADVSLENKSGWTALKSAEMMAPAYARAAIVADLKAAGAN